MAEKVDVVGNIYEHWTVIAERNRKNIFLRQETRNAISVELYTNVIAKIKQLGLLRLHY
mgnify:CR=1 FL=1